MVKVDAKLVTAAERERKKVPYRTCSSAAPNVNEIIICHTDKQQLNYMGHYNCHIQFV